MSALRLPLVAIAAWLMAMTALAAAQSTPAPAALDPASLFDKLKGSVLGTTDMTAALEKPNCLLTLRGGIDGIEETVDSHLRRQKTLVVFIASKNDPSSVSALDQYYSSVKLLCGETQELPTETEEQDGTVPAVDEATVEYALRRYTFAFLSFDDEPTMMWRWWVWKVPLMAFVTPSSDTKKRAYDIQFWSIAWTRPSSAKMVDAIRQDLWRDQLRIWDSSFAPGGSLDQLTRLIASSFTYVYAVLDPIPNWLLTILGSFVGMQLLSVLHRGDAAQAAAAAAARPKTE